MIQFFYEGHELVLPEDFSITLIEENPELTNNGEYSLDVTVSLLIEKNAIAFKHINRLNLTDVPTNGSAYQIVNGSVTFGRIVILKNSDSEVSFQFLAGNSDLNFLTKIIYSDKKIYDFDWGSETNLDQSKAKDSLQHTSNSPYNFVCPPVKAGGAVLNDIHLRIGYITNNTQVDIEAINPIVMQPFLKYYIRKFPEVIGYELDTNVLELDSRYHRLYILNSVSSLNYSVALPNWTIKEFVQNIEAFFNVAFIVDSKTKKLSIISLSEAMKSKKQVIIPEVLDEYTRDLSPAEVVAAFSKARISYDLNNTKYYYYQCFADEVMDLCTIYPFNNFSQASAFAANQPSNAYNIYRVGDYDYVKMQPGITLFQRKTSEDDPSPLWLVNKFRPVGDREDPEFKLKIVPAEIGIRRTSYSWYDNMGVERVRNFDIQFPISSNGTVNITISGLKESIENTVVSTPRLNKMEVAFYTGKLKVLKNLYGTGEWPYDIFYPFSHIDIHPEHTKYPMETSYDPEQDNWVDWITWLQNEWKGDNTLRLNGLNGVLSSIDYKSILDVSKLYIFKMKDSKYLDVDNLFFINNSLYMPMKFERLISNVDSLVTGYFYRMLSNPLD